MGGGGGGTRAGTRVCGEGRMRIFFLWVPPRFSRAACLQNKTAPKSLNFKTKNGPKNDPKFPRKILSLVLLCSISHRHYSKSFHREFPHKISNMFSRRESAGMATLRVFLVAAMFVVCCVCVTSQRARFNKFARRHCARKTLGGWVASHNVNLPFVQMALQTEKNIFELIMHFVADTDTDKNYFEINFFVAATETAVLCSLEGGHSRSKLFWT